MTAESQKVRAISLPGCPIGISELSFGAHAATTAPESWPDVWRHVVGRPRAVFQLCVRGRSLPSQPSLPRAPRAPRAAFGTQHREGQSAAAGGKRFGSTVNGRRNAAGWGKGAQASNLPPWAGRHILIQTLLAGRVGRRVIAYAAHLIVCSLIPLRPRSPLSVILRWRQTRGLFLSEC